MALLAPADFRPSTNGLATNEVVGRYVLTANDANDTDLTATIARLTDRIENLTFDDFTPSTTVLKLSPVNAMWKLVLPQRASAVTQVATRDRLGTLTVQSASCYRVRLTLDATGSTLVYPRNDDTIELLGTPAPSLTATDDPWLWPTGPQSVEVSGTFGWTTAPGDILRALALLVFHHYKPQRLDMGATTQITAAGQTQTFDTEGMTGLLEVDGILRRYNRRPLVMTG